ncbi:S8 family serine peptidase [Cytobacillus firmus]|uniref:S8 family serine peptidase n=1 Tax=Cytobacillus firmus TaxID=1399 RepID=UPI00384DB7B5
MKTFKGKGLAVGLAAALVTSSFLPAASLAAEKSNTQRIYQQLEQLNLKQPGYKTSSVTKEKDKRFTDKQLVVKYNKPLSSSEHRKAGGKLVKRFASLGYDVIEVQGKRKLEEVAAAYASFSNVTSITRSAYAKKLGNADPKVSEMYHLKNLGIEKAQTMAGKNKVKVAVIDGGVDSKHPELKNQLIANKNAMDPIKKGAPDPHGTHVAGIIAAEKGNGVGGYGIAPNSEVISIDVFNRSWMVTDYTIAEGILEAIRQKADVINMSLGGYFPSPIMQDAVKKAIDAGITVVAAAGNDGANVVNYPASFEGVISVGATNSKNDLADFSTFGPSVDVVAPGHQVYSSVYDPDKQSSFLKMSGTSMSSPVVAGAVSLLLSKHPNLTPYQVNYILTHTAKDLGDKGYDLKYGYGMIDLEKILSFDPKKIPADPAVKEAESLSKAKDLGEFNTIPISGKILNLNQNDLYKTKMKKDEYIQVTLDGSDKYDLKFELLFFSEGEKKPSKKVEVNEAFEGSLEGTLFKAPEAGNLVIIVKDSYGKFSEEGSSEYNLELNKSMELPDDGNGEETPKQIESLPYESALENYFTDERLTTEVKEDEAASTEENGEEGAEEEQQTPGDSDYFHFTVPGNPEDGMQTVKVDLSAVPGIDPAIKLHMIEEIEGEEFIYEMDQASDNGFGKGEELSFNAVPGQMFIAEVTNKPYIDEFMMMFEGYEIDLEKSYSSFNPYKLTIDSKTLPADEDGLPFEMGMETSPEEELMSGDIQGFIAKKKELQQKAIDPSEMTYEDYINTIKDAAVSFEENEGGEGYLQTFGDEDWFSFTPDHSSIFELAMDKASGYKPVAMEVLKYDQTMKDFVYVYSNTLWSMDGSISVEDKFTLGLQAGETYYFRAADPMYRPSFDPYRFTLTVKVKDVADQFEANENFDSAQSISTKGITGNFASSADTDIYYFKPGKESIFGVRVTPGSLPAKYKNVPVRHKSEIDPVIAIIEDTNGNGKLEPEEEGKITLVDSGLWSDEERISFRTKKNSGYFVTTFDYYGTNASLVPYVLKIDEANRSDEDKGSVVKNNIPSKPLLLNRPAKDRFYSFGYMNLTSNKGDTDFYKLKVEKEKNYSVTMEVPIDLDGKITIYNSKGVQVAVSDYYGKGDNEVFSLTLKKGDYYIKVEDNFGNASTNPYKIIIK